MANILYDFQAFKQKYGGISRYHAELLKLVPKCKENYSVNLPFLISNNYYLNSDHNFKKLELEKTPFKNYFKGRDFFIETFNKQKAIKSISENNFDVFHPTYYDPYFIKYLKKPLVITVHDFTHEKFKEYAIKKEIKNKALLIERAKKIIAISQNTKNDLLEIFPEVDESKVVVIHHGFRSDNAALPVGDISTEYIFGKKFILYVGKRTSYKNFRFFLSSIVPLLKTRVDLFLVCAGLPFTKNEKVDFLSFGINDKIISMQATDSQLRRLYENAIAFVFPSLYEGFGLPILEAFACGCPAIISNTSCFPEIGGDAAIYFDPQSSGSIYQTVSNSIEDSDLRTEKRLKGLERLKCFSWEETAKKTVEVYKEIIG